MIHILVVEDDKMLNKVVCSYLNNSGFEAKGCFSGEEGLDAMYNSIYELIVSDIMMPGIDGFEFAKMVRQVNKTIPILFMSATIAGEELPVTTREFNILYKLLSYPNKTFSRAQLMDEFWGVDTDTSFRAVDVYVTKLRDKFSACEGFKIVTIRGLGYKAVLQ